MCDLAEHNDVEEHPAKRHCPTGSPQEVKTNEMDAAYFKSYEDIGIHEDMIKDMVRTNSYRLAILRASEKLIGKVVLDVGAGTGVLSCFCIQAGAKKVYAIEASSMAEQAKKVAEANSAGGNIEVIRGRVEDIELPEKVDVIVSEWMGHFLLYESMLNSVICARDKWLKKDGIILPSKASLYLSPFMNESIYEERVEFWRSVKESIGVDMSCIEPHARKSLCRHVHVEEVGVCDLLARPCHLRELDLYTLTPSDLKCMKMPFKFMCYGRQAFCGFTSWFTVTFDAGIKGKEPLILSTSPEKHVTHWRQSCMYLEYPVSVEQDTVIAGNITLTPGEMNPRFLEIEVTFTVDEGSPVTRSYSMSDGSS
ncbi:protein arginine N-methyltransferase 6-like [Diadema setosum]|uniref:protein arginine N-methyltransferase 6-like n=1 Tax=Diadema setosum TaxID=31175 RepID=UPI003B3B4FAE